MRTRRLELHLNASTVEARSCSGGAVEWAAVACFESGSELRDAITELGETLDERSRKAEAVLLVHRPWVQVREVDGLPQVNERRLRSMIALQPLRYFRRTSGPLSTSATWADLPSRDLDTEPRALVGALDGACAEAAISGASDAGIRLITIRSAEFPALSFVPPALASRLQSEGRRAAIRAALLALACCIVAAVTIVAARVTRDRDLAGSIARILPVALAAAEARERVETGAAQLDSIAASRARRSRAGLALAAAISALGDSAHITEFAWRADGSGAMSGQAVRAADVLDRLSKQRTMMAAQLVSVSERYATPYGDREAFRIEFSTHGADR